MLGGNKKRKRTSHIDTLVGQSTELTGELHFTGGLHVDGTIRGAVVASDSGSLLSLSEKGAIEGEVRVPNVIINGRVEGDVYAAEHVELAAQARVNGDVYYGLIEMAMGAEVNGKLVHWTGADKTPLALGHEAAENAASEEPPVAES